MINSSLARLVLFLFVPSIQSFSHSSTEMPSSADHGTVALPLDEPLLSFGSMIPSTQIAYSIQISIFFALPITFLVDLLDWTYHHIFAFANALVQSPFPLRANVAF